MCFEPAGQPDTTARHHRPTNHQHIPTGRQIYTGRLHGYDVTDHLLRTNDRYELHLHRLVHPEDYVPSSPSAGARVKRKPYLLIHGLIGTSASFVTNVDELYRAPPKTYKAEADLREVLTARSQEYQYEWQSTAEYQRRESLYEEVPKFAKKGRLFAESLELQFEGEHMRFGREFRQAYKKFRLPQASIGYTTNSLAFTLSNFGYDVWLINLRGNRYSRRYDGPLNAEHAEYWNFNIDTIIKEDLAAAIRFISREAHLREDQPLGVVSYSYSSIHLMGLLTKFPRYQRQLRPIVMLAPTLLTGTSERGKFKYFMKLVNGLVSKNGPFPVWGRPARGEAKVKLLSLHKLDKRLERAACTLPVASKLCRLLEIILHGDSKQVSSVRGLLAGGRAKSLMQRDIDCGQTSKAIIHQIIENLSQANINPKYKPFAPAKQSNMPAAGREPPARPSLMIVHSMSDAISTPAEVRKIRDTALKTLTLADYLIQAPDFSHTDFLFSRRNQFLVNAEVVRMALVHDHLSYMFDAPPRAPIAARPLGGPGPRPGPVHPAGAPHTTALGRVY